jgi:lipoate-protein ligase A
MSASSLTVRNASRLRSTTARQAISLDITKAVFIALDVYHDTVLRSAAMNMAIDEALLELASAPLIRFYQWDHPALSFGYFGRYVDVEEHERERDLVRRWTGGGIVLHGDDLTYSIIVPASDSLVAESSPSIYKKIHRAISNALRATGARAELAAVSAVGDRHYNGACFANPVHADVLVNGRKVAGAAQRRTRAGLLHQGSIQHVDLGNGLAERFARELSEVRSEESLSSSIMKRAQEIAQQKYGNGAWLRKR